MRRAEAPDAAAVIETCAQASRRLLSENLTPQGILAARATPAAQARRYTRVFGRDAALCALAMLDSGEPKLEAGAIAGLDALAAGQAANGQIPKFVDPLGREADFWYLGCIDATLWWLLAVDHARRRHGFDHWRAAVTRALAWLQAQEHPRLALLQQNEASDWADIMPRAGFVLYTNALWYLVKRRFDLPGPEATHHHFNHLFHPGSADLPEYRRARLLRHYAIRGRRRGPDAGDALYLSFVNLGAAGDEGDVFGNLLAVLCGLASDARAHAIVQALRQTGAAQPHPIRVVTRPIAPTDPLWRAYMDRHRQNRPHQYHNGGIWPFVGGFWVLALARLRLDAAEDLLRLAAVNALDEWRFTEWFNGHTLAPQGMAGQSWNAATFLLARAAVQLGAADPFALPPVTRPRPDRDGSPVDRSSPDRHQ